MTDSGGRTTRTRLRERVRSGLLDFEYLASEAGLADRDLEQLREKLAENGELDNVLQEMIAFIYRLQPNNFERIVERGAEQGVARFNPEYSLGEVRIPIHRRGKLLQDAREKLANDEPLSERQIRVLLTDDATDLEGLQEHVRSHPLPAIEGYNRRFR